MSAVTKAAQDLVAQRYLLAEDVQPVVANAARHWDYVASAAMPSTPQPAK